jgi:hypothetical protein
MMKAIFKGQTIEFDENSLEEIKNLSEITGCPLEELKNIIRQVTKAYGSFSCSIEIASESLKEIAEAWDEMIDKMQYEHIRIKDKPEYCTFKSRLKPYEKRRSFQRPIFWKRIRSRLFKKPP